MLTCPGWPGMHLGKAEPAQALAAYAPWTDSSLGSWCLSAPFQMAPSSPKPRLWRWVGAVEEIWALMPPAAPSSWS